MQFLIRNFSIISATLLFLTAPFVLYADTGDDELDALLTLDMEELLTMEVSVASKADEKISEAPSIVNVITDKDIEHYGDKTLGDVLNHLPSFHILSPYLSQDNVSSIRGGSLTPYDNHTLLLINGRPIHDSVSGGLGNNIYRAFPVEAIKRVEVIRGPGSALYGTDAFSGVVNIITKKAKDALDTRVDVGYGSNNYRQSFISKGVSYKDVDIYAAGRFAKDDGWDHKYTGEFGVLHEDKFANADYAGIATLDYGNFSLSSYAATGIKDSIGGIPFNDNVKNSLNRQHVDVGYNFDVIDDLRIDTNLTANLQRWDLGDEDWKAMDYLGEVTVHYAPRDDLNILVGSTMEYRNGRLILTEYNNHWYSAYFQADYKPTEKIKLITGGQYNKVEGAEGAFVPRFGAIYNHNKNLGMKVLYGEAFRGPSAVESYIFAPGFLLGNPHLKAEEIATYDAQVFYNSKKYNLSATYFNSKFTDIIKRKVAAGGGFNYVNDGEITIDGIELEAMWSVTPQWRITGNATFQNSENEQGDVDITGESNTMVKTGVIYDAQNGIVTSLYDSYFGEGGVFSGANVVNPPADAYHLVSATVNFDLGQVFGNDFSAMNVVLHGENLLDKEVYYPEYIRQNINTTPERAGRLLYGTFSMKF